MPRSWTAALVATAMAAAAPIPVLAGPQQPTGMTTSASNALLPTADMNLAFARVYGRAQGMRCDGVSDDTTALQNAVNAAETLGSPSTSNGGAVLDLPPGFCIVSGAITVTKPLAIVGAGAGAGSSGAGDSGGTVIRTNSVTADVFTVTTNDAVTFDNFAIDAAGTVKTAGAGIAITGADSAHYNLASRISRMKISTMYDAVRFGDAYGWVLRDSTMLDFRHDGVLFTASATFPDGTGGGVSATNNIFWPLNTGATANAGIEIQGGGVTSIIGNKFLGSPYGVLLNLLQGPTGALHIIGNALEENRTANIALTQGTSGKEYANVQIVGNEINNILNTPSIGQLYVGTGTPTTKPKWIQNIAITGNTFSTQDNITGGQGQIDDGGGIVLSANTFHAGGGTVTAGIYVGAAAANVTVASDISENQPAGLFASPATFNWGAVNATAPAAPNLILNGGFVFDQSNEGTATTYNTQPYAQDMWQAEISATGGQVATSVRSTDAPAGGAYSNLTTVTTAGTTGASDFAKMVQLIPADALSALSYGTTNAQPAFLSFWAKTSVAGTYSVNLHNAANNRYFLSSCTISVAATWTKCGIPIPGDTGGTWVLTGQAKAAELDIILAAGSSKYESTANAWVADVGLPALSGQTNLTETLNATFQIADVKLEIGTVPTPFQPRPFAAELASLQRFYAKTFPQGTKPATNAGLAGARCAATASTTAGTLSAYWAFPAEMASSPAITTYNPSAANANWRDVGGASDAVVSVDPAGAKGTTGVMLGEQTTALIATHNLCIHATANARL